MNLSFRLCTQEDIPAVNDFFVKAYHFADNQEDMLYRYWLLQPNGCWLALSNEIPIGFGGAINYGLFSYIGMVCVDPAVQHRGIGEALMRQMLVWEEAQGHPTLLLEANPKAISLYTRLGFVEEETTLQFRLLESREITQQLSDVHLLREQDIPELARFDAPYFGGRREKILRARFAENPERAFVTYDSTSKITGYIFAQQHALGPWVARTAEDAETLLLCALALYLENTGPSVTIPASNKVGQALLQSYGFRELSSRLHMRRGLPAQSMQRAMIYGQSSLAVG